MRIRLATTVATLGAALFTHPGTASAATDAFDLQAHRGGRALVVENTIPAFANALELGVTTLELDIQITRDGREVVGHDARVDEAKCTDTAPVSAGDKQYPYVGKLIKDLTFEQVRTLDCGSKTQSAYPGQQAAPGAKMPTLAEVFALAADRGADTVRFSIELKNDPVGETTAGRGQFVQQALHEIRSAGVEDRAVIQSFDWGTLELVHQTDPTVPLYALTDITKVYPLSPWTGGLNLIWESESLVRGAKSIGATALSPIHAVPPEGRLQMPVISQRLVDTAHEHGILLVPWTVNEPEAMRKLIDKGVDGIITDYPDRLREVMREQGLPLPGERD
ncbi:glycerophosphodiester phosphodiesterase family protein [Nocardia sp. NPDC050406]|uniref:glycerophosphodiester phosphodiesterase family protein n=1 Tax=Nocardia sp. NPDC050406 TaxID=3364318 RepID=UPI0037BB2ABE